MEKYSYQTMAPLFRECIRIMEHEAKLDPRYKRFVSRPSELYKAANYLAEIAKAAILQRAWCPIFGLTDNQKIAYESVGAHTNLVMAMVDRALVALHGPDYENITKASEGYTYREIMEAIRLHDLPENAFGDWPDNGNRDEAKKAHLEDEYYNEFWNHYLDTEDTFAFKVRKLIKEMNERKRIFGLGRLLYAADKAAAVIIALTYDAIKRETLNTEAADELPPSSPMMHDDYPGASHRNKAEMALCDFGEAGYHKASEMFTTDIMSIRHLNGYDDTGFFTGLIIMYTLMINGHWYNWREEEYQATNDPPP